jgi:hypothetical protein
MTDVPPSTPLIPLVSLGDPSAASCDGDVCAIPESTADEPAARPASDSTIKDVVV